MIQDVNRRVQEKRKRQKRNKVKRFFKKVFIVVLMGTIAFGIYSFDKHPISRLSTIKVQGNTFYQESDILDQAKIQAGDRMITNLPFMVKRRVQKLPLVEKASVNVYYNKGYLTLDIKEVKAVAYSKDETVTLYFSNGASEPANADTFDMIAGLPLLSDFTPESITPRLLQELGDLPDEAFVAISEIYFTPKELDPTAMKMVMNDEYFVYLSIETLPMLGQYATLLNGANEFNKCIDMIEYGPDESSQTAIVRRCETN